MGHDTFICCVCGDSTTRKKSYATPNGRACRKHEEAQTAHANTLAEEQYKRDRAAAKMEEQNRALKNHRSSLDDAETKCWCCGQPGVRSNDFVARSIDVLSQLQYETGEPADVFNPNSAYYSRMRDWLGARRVLKNIPIPENYPDGKLYRAMKYGAKNDLVTLARVVGMIIACQHCAKLHGFDFNWNLRTADEIKIADMLYAYMNPSADTIMSARALVSE